MLKRLLVVLTTLLIMFPAWAQEVQVRADHPGEYVVVKGDTLWDISGKFLEKPWQWPAIWQANPQIENPHLIYPGDRLSLVYIDGQPRLQLSRDKRLSPAVRQVSFDEAIPPIPLDAIDEFLRNPRVVDPDTLENLPYVVKNYEQRRVVAERERTYVRGIQGHVGQEVVLARLTFAYEDQPRLRKNKRKKTRVIKPHKFDEAQLANFSPVNSVWRRVLEWRNKPVEVLGYELWEVARGRIVKQGDPAIVEIVSADQEVMEGDYALPLNAQGYPAMFYPRAMRPMPEDLRVLTTSRRYYGAGHHDLIAINGGTQQGIAPGHVFSAFRPGETVRDDVKYPAGSIAGVKAWKNNHVTLPDEYDGTLMVFRSFENVSYAIMLEGERPIRAGDILRHPDDRL